MCLAIFRDFPPTEKKRIMEETNQRTEFLESGGRIMRTED